MTRLGRLSRRFRRIISRSGQGLVVFKSEFPFHCFTRTCNLSCCTTFSKYTSSARPDTTAVTFLVGGMRSRGVGAMLGVRLDGRGVTGTVTRTAGTSMGRFCDYRGLATRRFTSKRACLDLVRGGIRALERILG